MYYNIFRDDLYIKKELHTHIQDVLFPLDIYLFRKEFKKKIFWTKVLKRDTFDGDLILDLGVKFEGHLKVNLKILNAHIIVHYLKKYKQRKFLAQGKG